jgi:Mg-chelatase subunit ChlD
MNDELPDSKLDAELREVPLPEDLLARLRTTSMPDDGEIDRALRETALPNEFLRRLRTRVDDLIIDDAVRDVAVPAGLLEKLRVIPESREVAPWRRMALAASLLLIIGGLYGLALVSLVNARRPQVVVVEKMPVIDLGPLRLELHQSQLLAVHLPPDRRLPARFVPPPVKPNALTVELVPFDRRVSPGSAGKMFTLLGSAEFDPNADVFSMRFGVLGAPHIDNTPPSELERITLFRARGVDLPLVRGYDRGFWLKQRVHPPISPRAHPNLGTSHVVLSNRTDSVELTRRRIADRRLPDAYDIRVEDFLAAVDYHFPSPIKSAVAIRTAAGPSLFERQSQLLQIGVKAGRARRRQATTHLTVALDISTSMGAGDRLEMAKRAIAKLAAYAGPRDRISLVVFHHDVVYRVQSLNCDQLDQLPNIVAPLRATGGDNLASGLREAMSLLLGSGLDDRFARNLVVLTDGQDDLPPTARRFVDRVLAAAEEHSIKTTFVQISPLTSEALLGSHLPDRSGVSYVQAQTDKDVLWGLVEGLTGASVAVAYDPVLNVEFNPAAVQAYRLVGHGTSATSGLGLAETTTLHNDEEATALYEVWLYPNSLDEIAWVRASWRDPQTGGRRETKRQLVSRLQFATSVGEMPLSLQAAAVAGEIGKILSGGYDFELSDASSFQHHKKSSDFRQLTEACQKLNPSLESWAEYRDLVELLTAMDNVRRNQAP